ncbi:hypothetical protein H2200_002034 [Cladophialophora chaetospira]|uniref:Uncharacterized protein n=1 Tax=Cladophialophora chaetospira TaxID=386627 RepID=A0AA39CN38_9EURO|nr:hypothetical protein H2200_002034 [Cladophialophora chaetospira]
MAWYLLPDDVLRPLHLLLLQNYGHAIFQEIFGFMFFFVAVAEGLFLAAYWTIEEFLLDGLDWWEEKLLYLAWWILLKTWKLRDR